MATAVAKKVAVPVPAVVNTYTVELTDDEAQQLVAILGHGNSLVNGLFMNLSNAGVVNRKYSCRTDSGNGNIVVRPF